MESNEIKDLIREAQRSKSTTLDLSTKRLTSLPSEIFELTNLTELNISNNQLTSLPPKISELKNLIKFDISGNQLSSLPPEIGELKNLTSLKIYWNKLNSLPSEISKLQNLESLNLTTNRLFSLPPEISKLQNLKLLDISDNEFIVLPSEISDLKNIIIFFVTDNQLSLLPSEISKLQNLNRLDLSRNQLSSLPSELSKLQNLTHFKISGNRLSSFPSEIFYLQNLKVLNISGNQLTSLPSEVLELDLDIGWKYQLGENGIFLEGNPLQNPPIEIIKQGRESVIDYFKSLEGEKSPLNEIKVLLVGDGGVGKTSLVKRLVGEEFNENESQTHGINIKKWMINEGEIEIKANFWDFGGQEIMHTTHQFFLSKRSLYILVLDGRKDEKAEYWLKHIENFGGDSPILVVINKIDENPGFDQNRKFLRDKYSSVRGFYRLSCKSGEGIGEFSKNLGEELAKVLHTKEMWAKSWFNVKSRLEEMCPNCNSNVANENKCEHCSFIQYKDYKLMCDEEGIKDESQQSTLVDFLHNLGVILHFKDISLLNTYVLDPEWITNAVYKVVNSKEVISSGGILKHDMFAEILKKNNGEKLNYPPDQYGFILSLMNKFELSYDLDDSTVLLPSLLEIQEPDYAFDYEGTLRGIIEHDFLPPSVMPRFIVKMNRDIKDDLRWRTGVVLENKGYHSTAVIRADIEAKRISICVNGNQRRDYFSVILQTFREINNSFEKLKATEKISLPDDPEVTVGYEHLIKLELRGIETYIPDGSDNEYKVSDLLGTVINRSNERALLEEILRISDMNRSNQSEILKMLRKFHEVEEDSDDEDTRLEKWNKIVMAEPNFYGVGLRLNELLKMYIKSKKSKKG